ncbi:MAG: hypothetical protein GF347_01160 [Candidatus Moranbacteria bacterium]|nr:hypothetical protein [Candidatus Moranbacteria bacterium]
MSKKSNENQNLKDTTNKKEASLTKKDSPFLNWLVIVILELYRAFVLTLVIFYVGLISTHLYFEFTYKSDAKNQMMLETGEKDLEQPADQIAADEKEIKEIQSQQEDQSAAAIDQPLNLNTDNWQVYKSKSYYFTLKYPSEWGDPKVVKPSESEDLYYSKIFFTKPSSNEAMPIGFEVMVFSDRYYNLEDTNPLVLRDFTTMEGLDCGVFPEIKIGPNDQYPGKRVSVKKNNPCFNEAYFYSVSRNGYIYNFVPVPEGGYHQIGYDGEESTARDLPEFETILSTVTFQTPPKPKPKAPKPVSAKKVNGKLVCRGGDATKWSLNNKPGHLDRECCLDPDETPNPWCSYSAENLQKVNEMKAEGPPKDYKKKWDL